MTNTEKQKINRVIAEAMGWRKLKAHASGPTGPGSTGWIDPNGNRIVEHPPDPYDSISDALEAADAILGEEYWIHIIKMKSKRDGTGFHVYFGNPHSLLLHNAHFVETRSAAVALALVKYIKEEK